MHIHYRLRGGSREDVPGQWTCSQCFAPRCWPVLKRRCDAAREDLHVSSKVKEKGNGKGDTAVGPLGRKPPPTAGNVPPTTRKPQVVPPRGKPGAGCGGPPTPETPPPKQQERVKLRERELLEAVERQANYEKQEQKLLEMIAMHEHNFAQHKANSIGRSAGYG